MTSLRNDGTTNPQVTPLYLVLETLNEIDAAFAQYAQANPQRHRAAGAVEARALAARRPVPRRQRRRTRRRRASPIRRCQGSCRCSSASLRSQLWSYCAPALPTASACPWARTQLWTNASTTIGGPTFAAAMDLNEAIRQNDAGRTADGAAPHSTSSTPASNNDALAELLASTDDIIQVMRDDANLVPFYHVLAAAAVAHHDGRARQRAARRGRRDDGAPRARRGQGLRRERQRDLRQRARSGRRPERRPREPGDAHDGQQRSADRDAARGHRRHDRRREPRFAGRAAPSYSDPTTRTWRNELSEFLLDPQRGLEQFYAIVRNGTEH